MDYTIEFYSRKPLLKRRQYYWRIRHANGNIVADSGEGYYNKADRNEAYYRLRAGIRDESFIRKDLD